MKHIVCADALEWLASDSAPRGSIVTSPPLALELDSSIDQWREFYHRALLLCFAKLGDGCPAVIYSTDQKNAGRLASSFAAMMAAAAEAGLSLLWHKIVLRRDPGKIDIHRPGFSHMAAFGGKGCRPGKATPDCIARGKSLYPNGIGMIPARMAVEFAARPGLPVIDPFCGQGTIPAIAEALGFQSIGVDIDPAQCEKARRLSLKVRVET